MYKKKSMGYLLLFCVGLFQIFLGMFFFFNPIKNHSTFILITGLALMLCGVLYVFSFTANSRSYFRPGWVLIQGILEILLGLFFVYNRNIEIVTLTTVFGIWALFTGATQFAVSFQIKALEFKRWWWVSFNGSVNVIIGYFILLNAMYVSSLFLIPIAIFAILLGLMSMVECFVYK